MIQWRSMSDEENADARMLVLVHRIAATRLGFPDVYAALNDNGSQALKDGLLEGTAWVLRPFISYLLPLAAAARDGKDFELMSLLRTDSPAVAEIRAGGQDVAALLDLLAIDVASLAAMFAEGSQSTIRDVLNFVREHEIAVLDDRFIPYLNERAIEDPNDEDSEYQSVIAFLACRATQLWGYNRYVRDISPFATQQGIKALNFSACSWCWTTRKATTPSSRTANTGDWNHYPQPTRKISPKAKIRCWIAHAVSFMSAARGLFTISRLCSLLPMPAGHTQLFWRKTSFRPKTYTSSTGR